MPTAKQTAANRTNSQKSTGPGTTAGKAASSYNALKHGIFATTQIMFDEKAEDLAALAAEYHEHHHPADPEQRFLVDTLVNNEWRLRRLRRVEAELWDHATNAYLAQNAEAPACTSGDAFATGAPTFERLQRIVNSCERIYHRAHKDLEVAQQVARGHALRRQHSESEPESQPTPAASTPQPEHSKATSANLVSFRQNDAPASPAGTRPQPSALCPDPPEPIDASPGSLHKPSSTDL